MFPVMYSIILCDSFALTFMSGRVTVNQEVISKLFNRAIIHIHFFISILIWSFTIYRNIFIINITHIKSLTRSRPRRLATCKVAGEESEEEKEKEQRKENNDSTKTRTYNCGLLNSPGTNQQTTDYTRREMPTDSAACRSFSLPPSPS